MVAQNGDGRNHKPRSADDFADLRMNVTRTHAG
jgi:hypothetical protein